MRSLLLFACFVMAAGVASGERPNVVVVLADDFGYGDLAIQNRESRIPTPHLDELARQGARFTDAHSPSAVCTPTRYGLLTGRYCWRTRLKSGVLFPPNDRPLIEPTRFTIAKLLKSAGYATAAIGKWHLGIDWSRDADGDVDFSGPIGYGPTDTGFDRFYGIAGSLDMIPYAFIRDRQIARPLVDEQPGLSFPRFVRKGPRAEGFDCGRVLDDLTDEAVAYVQGRAGKEQPFFLYFPLTSPHKPVWPSERFVGATALGPYGDFVAQTDAAVGRVLSALEAHGFAESTIVVFTSDNGSFMTRVGPGEADHTDNPAVPSYRAETHRANGPLRGGKADIYEGGHRVPFLVRWPATVAPGATIETPICHVDLLATLAEIVDATPPDSSAEDSHSFAPWLRGDAAAQERPPIVHHSVGGMFAVRDGKWKLVLGDGSGGRLKPRGKNFERPYQLFDMAADPSEQNDVASDYPAVVQRLSDALDQIRGAEAG